MKQLRTAGGAEGTLSLDGSSAAGLVAHLHEAAAHVLARTSAAFSDAFAGIYGGDASDGLPNHLPNMRTNFEQERFYFLVGWGLLFFSLTVVLLIITHPGDYPESEAEGSKPAETTPRKQAAAAAAAARSPRASAAASVAQSARSQAAEERATTTSPGRAEVAAAAAQPQQSADGASQASKGWQKLASATLSSNTPRGSAAARNTPRGSAAAREVPQHWDDPTSPGARFASVVQGLQRLQSGIKSEEGEAYFEVLSERLVEDKGISGLCVVCPTATCGVTGVQVWTVVVTSALQCWLLQFFVLYWLYAQIVPRQLKDGAIEALPWSIVFAAAYTHFISCVSDFAFDFYLLYWIRSRKEPYRWVFVTVFLMDAFIIPMMTLIIGTMYLINSKDVHETILNCCAVAFISHIDDWILSVSGKMEEIVGRTDYHKTIKVNINRKTIQRLNWWVCLIPVVPTSFTLLMMWLGQKAKL